MFDFIFKDKKGEIQYYMDMITIDVKKLEISKLAINKAVNMIAHAIAKSEFVVKRKGGREKDHIYWMLNIRPNPNETATDFWMEVIRKLLLEEECLICYIWENLYRAESYTKNDTVMLPQEYSDITIIANEQKKQIFRKFKADEVIHLKAYNKKIREYLEKIVNIYDGVISAMAAAKKIGSTPKFSLDIPAQLPVIRRKNADGTEEKLTVDDYKQGIKRLLESDDIEVIQNSNGMDTKQLKIESNVTSEDITKMAKEIFTECAFAFDIPLAAYLGEITEKADSTNEFITYAVGWIVELINDSLNAKLVGEEDYLKGEEIWIDMSRYKHIDAVESAANLDKLRSIGFNFDEIRKLVGYEALNTEFSQERVITKNYTDDLGGEADEKKKV